jgi:hypothetical protein
MNRLKLIDKVVTSCLKNNVSYEEIINDKNLLKSFKQFELINSYNYLINKINNKKKHQITLRLDDETFNLLHDNKSKMIREAIINTFGRGNMPKSNAKIN